ncbi:hypothetical protein [Brevibacillus brevis]|uniref:hypothetical protein n=1 Tax=Brevibacillus brevis TaxID=1393 RepID=UPI001EDA204A|nr:hypothetical protein [Brevibacillus brevis]UKK99471.1 hypothetical protein FO446_19455 [Brevibacillus brevis]
MKKEQEKIINSPYSAIIVTIAIIVLLLSFSFIFIKTGDSNWATVLSGIFSAIGAVIGGIIAGQLTLQGVTQTLKRDKEEKFVDSYFHKYIVADEVSNDLKPILNLLFLREN